MRLLSLLLVAVVAVSTQLRGVASADFGTSSNKCDLSYLLVSGGLQLTPGFTTPVTGYTVHVPTAVTEATLQAWQTDVMSYVDVSINGGAYSPYQGAGNPTANIPLTANAAATIRITCSDCQKTYTVSFICDVPTTPVTPVIPAPVTPTLPVTPAGCGPMSIGIEHGNTGTCSFGIAAGATCSIGCNTGYTVSGSPITCVNGQWAGFQQCIADVPVVVTPPVVTPPTTQSCGPMTTTIANGNAGTCSFGLAHGASCSISCYTGYTVSGNSLTCNNGQWSGFQQCVFTAPTTPTYPTIPGGVIGDPQFTGLRGQSYQVHGVAGEVYNIISAKDMQLNAKFVFLSKGECPTLNGVKAKGCFSHAGSYLGEIGISTVNGDKIKLVSGSATSGFTSVNVNGRDLIVDDTVVLSAGTELDGAYVSRNSTHLVTVQTGNFAFQFENSDMYINQRVKVLDWSVMSAHGLLGQTYQLKKHTGSIKEIEGEVEDYVVEGRDVFGKKFTFNQFKA